MSPIGLVFDCVNDTNEWLALVISTTFAAGSVDWNANLWVKDGPVVVPRALKEKLVFIPPESLEKVIRAAL